MLKYYDMSNKIDWEISINDSKQISGGYLENRLMTKTQVQLYCSNLGKEMLRNNRHLESISYTCWESDDDFTKDVGTLAYAYVSVTRVGKKLQVFKDSSNC